MKVERIFFIRHGKCNKQKYSDYNILDSEIEKINTFSNNVLKHGFKFDLIVSSGMKRSLQTAEIISNNIDVPFFPINELSEVNSGNELDELNSNQIVSNDIIVFNKWCNNENYLFKDGECFESIRERQKIALEKIAKLALKNGNILIVGHKLYLTLLVLNSTNIELIKRNPLQYFTVSKVLLEDKNDENILKLIYWNKKNKHEY